MVTIKNENFYVVQGWMLTKLGLSGNHLIIYAILWSFSQDGVSEFRGTVDYIADFSGAGRRTVVRVLETLEERGLIEKEVYNDKTGKTNGYKCVPFELLEIEAPEIEDEVEDEGVCQNGTGGYAKMTHPVCQNGTGVCQNGTPPLHNKIENKHISNLYKKESKKESNIYNNSSTCACEETKSENADKASYLPEFEKMTDEELLDFGEGQVIDFEDEHFYEILNAYQSELKRRKETSSKKWRKKVVRSSGKFEYLKSHEDIMREMCIEGAYANKLREWLIHSYANHRLVTNAQLESIISKLEERFEEDDVAKIECIDDSLQRGYIGIVIGGAKRE